MRDVLPALAVAPDRDSSQHGVWYGFSHPHPQIVCPLTPQHLHSAVCLQVMEAMSRTFGDSIWDNTMLVLTHGMVQPPEGVKYGAPSQPSAPAADAGPPPTHPQAKGLIAVQYSTMGWLFLDQQPALCIFSR